MARKLPSKDVVIIGLGWTGAILASELDLPIVPVALDGVYKVWPRKSRRIRLARVKIHFGVPINAGDMARTAAGEDGYQKITDVLAQRIQTMLDEMRST